MKGWGGHLRALPVRVKVIAVVVLLAAAGLAVYAPSVHNGFLMDDVHVVYQNPLIRNVSFILPCFLRPFLKFYYRPVTHLSFMADYGIWKLDPFGYHLTSVILHICNSCLVFFLLFLLWNDIRVACIAGLLFAVHPAAGIPVNYIADRSNLLSALFMLSALISFLSAFKFRNNRFIIPGFVFFVFALLSHEISVVFPAYLVCIFAAMYDRRHVGKMAGIAAGAVCIAAAYFLIRMSILHYGAAAGNRDIFVSWQGASSFFFMAVRYMRLVAYPRESVLIYTIGPEFVSGMKGAMYAVFGIGVAGCAILAYRRWRGVWFGLSWFIAGILPLYYLMFSRPEMGLIMQDNWGYVPSIGLIAVFSFILAKARRIARLHVWLALVLAVVLSYGSMSRAHSALWKDELTYCSYWLGKVPHNPYAFNTLGALYGRAGDYVTAKEYFLRGVDCFRGKGPSGRNDEILAGPLTAILYNNLGMVAEKEGDIAAAVGYYQSAVLVDEQNARAHARLAMIYASMKDENKASFHKAEAMRIDPYCLAEHAL
ncbi:MAG: hypothetical protein PHS64_05040 [Candidatus Omnitrophica bacterium]|nr:hypothetical protein [Candidatus Omnitrophota bacterium]MDD5775286.1 hypothetical protein [Candidatus Omnitrophota bacterium]